MVFKKYICTMITIFFRLVNRPEKELARNPCAGFIFAEQIRFLGYGVASGAEMKWCPPGAEQ